MARTPRVTKEPQCRHKDEFVSYDATLILGSFQTTATCANCSSTGYGEARVLDTAREYARIELMRKEAPPVLVP